MVDPSFWQGIARSNIIVAVLLGVSTVLQVLAIVLA